MRFDPPPLSPSLTTGSTVETEPERRKIIDRHGNVLNFPIERLVLEVEPGPSLQLPSGSLTVADTYQSVYSKNSPLAAAIVPGEYPTSVGSVDLARYGRVLGFVACWFENQTPTRFVQANRKSDRWTSALSSSVPCVGVDSGSVCLTDSANTRAWTLELQQELERLADRGMFEQTIAAVTLPGTSTPSIICRSGKGDGLYPMLYGLNGRGKLCCVVVDFNVLQLDIWKLYSAPLLARLLGR